MRTFHIGGTASQTFKQPIIKAKTDGKLHSTISAPSRRSMEAGSC